MFKNMMEEERKRADELSKIRHICKCGHVVDTKGYRTEVYKIKKKLFMKKFGIVIEEI